MKQFNLTHNNNKKKNQKKKTKHQKARFASIGFVFETERCSEYTGKR